MRFNSTNLAQVVVTFLAAFVTACANSQSGETAIRFAFPSMSVAGRYENQITVDDVRQIKKLAHDRSDILKPVDQIVIDRPDEAEVKCGGAQKTGDPMTSFDVRKKNGRWFIIGKPYTTRDTIITG
jgi:hypothetical protein